jgi:threonine/homoserine/homoserine lactone efflux protein
MTASPLDLALYAFALFVLFITPGPVWLAILARALSGGFRSAWPLAFGVAVGDVIWPLLAILGLNWIVAEYAGALTVLRWLACAFFLWLGWSVIRSADKPIAADSSLTKPGMIAGFLAGLVAILGNPKAILFYLGVLPGFFDLGTLTQIDITLIVILSVVVPFIGNLLLAWIVGFVRNLLSEPRTLRRLNLSAGWMLVLVGLVLPWT